MFLVYETKFTVGKSQEMVFTSVQGRGEVVGGEFNTCWESSKRCLHKTMGIATVRKLASKQALGLEALLVTIGD